MAWTDYLRDTKQSLGASLDRRQRSRDSAFGGMQQALGQLGAQRFAKSERLGGEAFTTSEREAGELFKTGEREAGEIYATGAEQRRFKNEGLLDERQAELQRKTNQIVFNHDEAMRDLQDDDAREREKERFANEMLLIEEEWDRNWGDFTTAMEVHDPSDPSKIYTVNSRADFEVLLRSLEEKSRIAAVTLEAQLRAGAADDTDKGVTSGIFDAEFGKLIAGRPDLWLPGQGDYITVDQKTFNDLARAFGEQLDALVSDGYITGEERGSILSRLPTYVLVEPVDEEVEKDSVISLDAASMELLQATIAALSSGAGSVPFTGAPPQRATPPREGETRAEVGAGPQTEEAEAAALDTISILEPLLGRKDSRELGAFRAAIERSGPDSLVDPGTWELLIDLLEELTTKFVVDATGTVE